MYIFAFASKNAIYNIFYIIFVFTIENLFLKQRICVIAEAENIYYNLIYVFLYAIDVIS